MCPQIPFPSNATPARSPCDEQRPSPLRTHQVGGVTGQGEDPNGVWGDTGAPSSTLMSCHRCRSAGTLQGQSPAHVHPHGFGSPRLTEQEEAAVHGS